MSSSTNIQPSQLAHAAPAPSVARTSADNDGTKAAAPEMAPPPPPPVSKPTLNLGNHVNTSA